MAKRIISSIIGIPILVFLCICGGAPLQVMILIVTLIGMHEIYAAMSGRALNIHFVGYFFAVLYMSFIGFFTNKNGMMVLIALLMLSSLAIVVLFHTKISIRDIAVTIFGFVYVAILMSCIYLVRQSTNGIYSVWLIFISAWGCDTGAYFVGKTIGKHKLIKSLSPNKTVEGAIGGVVVAALLAALYGYGLQFFRTDVGIETVFRFAAIVAVGAVLAQFGDLSASAIKRYAKIKDFGNIIPGHGGILDRFDSVLFTAPAVYILITIFMK